MRDFTITLDNKEYKCTSSQTNGKDEYAYDISVKHGDIRTNIHIPMDKKITRAKVILFIEAFHVGLHKAFDEQQLDQNYVWNRNTNGV